MSPGKTIVLALVAISLANCGRTLVYERKSRRNGYQFELDSKRLTHHPVGRDYKVDSAMAQLPTDSFKEARGGILTGAGCWRFETRDGHTYKNTKADIQALIDEDVILAGYPVPYQQRPLRLRDIKRIASAEPFALDLPGGGLSVRRIAREGNRFIIETADGRKQIVPAGAAKISRWQGKPFGVEGIRCGRDPSDWVVLGGHGLSRPPIYVLDASGNAFAFVFGCDETYLDRWLADEDVSTDRVAFTAIPMRRITRWEFDKDWAPTMLVAGAWNLSAGFLSFFIGTSDSDHYRPCP